MEFKRFKNQDYHSLKNQCAYSYDLFEDPEFPAVRASIYRFDQPESLRGTFISWRRPFEIVNNPKFIVDGICARDLFQGAVGDCWFIAGTAAVADVSKDHINLVVPDEQSFERSEGYCGIFHFRFWKYGQWYDVVVDDRLPVDQFGQLVFCSNKHCPNEFWGPLLEKAYAKLASCYEFIHLGCSEDAIVNMTGGISEVISIPEAMRNRTKNQLWKCLYDAYLMGSASNASIPTKPGNAIETERKDGLVEGHSYSITKVVEISSISNHRSFSERLIGSLNYDSMQDYNYYGRTIPTHDAYGSSDFYSGPYRPQQSDGVSLVRLRNPWGRIEWKGAWSDSSPEWNNLNRSQIEELGLVKDHDGEFWMSFDDFIKNFVFISIVHVNLNAYMGRDMLYYSKNSKLNWNCLEFHGDSKKGSFWNNQQHFISLKKAYNYNSSTSTSNSNTASLIVSLINKECIREKKFGKIGVVEMELHLYRVSSYVSISDHTIKHNKFRSDELKKVDAIRVKTCSQEFSRRFDLKEGNYVVMALIDFANSPCKYYLRLFTENEMQFSDASLLCDIDNKVKDLFVNESDDDDDGDDLYGASKETKIDVIDCSLNFTN